MDLFCIAGRKMRRWWKNLQIKENEKSWALMFDEKNRWTVVNLIQSRLALDPNVRQVLNRDMPVFIASIQGHLHLFSSHAYLTKMLILPKCSKTQVRLSTETFYGVIYKRFALFDIDWRDQNDLITTSLLVFPEDMAGFTLQYTHFVLVLSRFVFNQTAAEQRRLRLSSKCVSSSDPHWYQGLVFMMSDSVYIGFFS